MNDNKFNFAFEYTNIFNLNQILINIIFNLILFSITINANIINLIISFATNNL